MELGNTGVLFGETWGAGKDIDPKWIQFNSEIAIRKGDEGWVINSRVDNWSNDDKTYFEYLLTTYKYDGTQWTKKENPRLWEDPSLMNGTPQLLTKDSGTYTINSQNQKLVIQVPTNTWFNNSDWVSPSATSRTKNKTHQKTENWSGIWIEDETKESNSWIFENIKLYIGEEKNSLVFCKGTENDCFQSSTKGTSTKKPTESDKWSQAVESSNYYNNEKARDTAQNTVKEIIDKLKGSKGYWAKLEDICESEVSETPDEERQKQLRMYCSNGKTN